MSVKTQGTLFSSKIINKTVAFVDQTSANNSTTKLVVYFDRALCSNSTGTLFANNANMKSYFAYDGTAGNYTSATYNFATRSITFVFTAAENGNKLTVANNTIYDQQGIEYGNDGTDYYLFTSANTPKWAKSNTDDTGYTNIDLVLEVPEIGGKPSRIDTTHLTSTIKTNMPGLKDPGDLQFKFIYENSTNWQTLKALETNEALGYFKITYDDGTSVEFAGYVTISMDSAKIDDKLTFTATISVDAIFLFTDI